MKVSNRGLVAIAQHEGIVLGPYLDSVGVWTYGIGHTSGAGNPSPEQMSRENTEGWSENQVNSELRAIMGVFAKDIAKFERRVSEAVNVQLEQHEFDALVSFDFNTGGIFKAKLTKEINSGNKSGKGFMGWLKPKEIRGRRESEQKLFQIGEYPETPIALYDAQATGRTSRRGALTPARLLSAMLSTAPKPAFAAPEPKNGGLAGILAAIVAFIQAILKRKD